MSDDLQARIADAVARVLAERGAGVPAAPTTGGGASQRSVVTLEDVTDAARSGGSVHAPAGAIVTALAREEAERVGVRIVVAGDANATVGPTTARHERQTESTGYCTQCGGCTEPAVYDRRSRRAPTSTAELIVRLDRFTEMVWRSEPNEVRRLRQLSRPPMGRLPGIFYACFNLFWLGEEVQTLRDKAKAGSIPLDALNALLASLCNRHAVRLSKWYLVDSIELLGDVQSFLEAHGAQSYDEYRELCEHLMLAADRLQAWIDRMIPWHTLDARLELVP